MVYSLCEQKPRKTIFRLNTVILTKEKRQSINYVNLPTIDSNKLMENKTRLVVVYFCDDAHDEILETNFQG